MRRANEELASLALQMSVCTSIVTVVLGSVGPGSSGIIQTDATRTPESKVTGNMLKCEAATRYEGETPSPHLWGDFLPLSPSVSRSEEREADDKISGKDEAKGDEEIKGHLKIF